MTNETITAPKKRKPMILAAVCFMFCIFPLFIDSALPYVSNIFGLPTNLMIDGTTLETLSRILIAISLLIVAIMLFLGKKGALLYVPLFLLGGGHTLLWACKLSYDLLGLGGKPFPAFGMKISVVSNALFGNMGSIFVAAGFLVFALWVMFASNGKLLKLWFVPFIIFTFPAAMDFIYAAGNVLDVFMGSYLSFATYFFTFRIVNMLLALTYTLCAFFTCLNIKKNS